MLIGPCLSLSRRLSSVHRLVGDDQGLNYSGFMTCGSSGANDDACFSWETDREAVQTQTGDEKPER